MSTEKESQLRANGLPKHLAITMDGNGRWAEQRGQPRLFGHREGARSVQVVTRAARGLGIEALTLYAFSSQNWGRPVAEVSGLMTLLREFLLEQRDEILNNGIRLRAIGQLSMLPEMVREPLGALEQLSRHNRGMVLTLALSYGGREELLDAVRAIAAKTQRGELEAETLEQADVAAHLWTHGLPELDLVIRTSGENRLSNFLLWQSAYAEYVFTPTLWPDFREAELHACLEQYQRRQRRFGLSACPEPSRRAPLRPSGTSSSLL